MTTFTDRCAIKMTAASATAVAAYDDLVEDVLAHAARAPESLAALLAADPDNPLGWTLKGILNALLARRECFETAAAALARAEAAAITVGITAREAHYLAALRALVARRFAPAIERLEAVLEQEPDDTLAAKLSHALRFMLGDADGMRASISRVLERGAAEHPHRGYLLGCRAFALEEIGAYAEAEVVGRTALALAPRDAWGLHAVAHVFEMTGRPRAGIDWLARHADKTAHCNNFGQHVTWHQALFRLELGETLAALTLYDERIRRVRSDDFRDVANAVSLLARLEAEGVDVGARWEELADVAERRVRDGSLVFADLHYLLALVGAGRRGAAAELAAGLAAGADRAGEQAEIARSVGGAVADGLLARRRGAQREAAQALVHARVDMARIGGSRAQRDVFERITIDTAITAGLGEFAARGLAARLAERPGNRFALSRLALIEQRCGGAVMPIAAAAAPAR